MRRIFLISVLAVMMASLSSCSLIDDQLDSRDETRTIDCRLHIYSNIDSVLVSQIKGTDGQDLLSALSVYYKSLLNPNTYDVSLNFYDAAANTLLSSNNASIRGGNDVVTLTLPSGDLRCVAQTQQPKFSGRQEMPDGKSRYSLHLYPVEAQVAVGAKVDKSIKNVLITVEGCADSFNAIDSTYTYYNNVDTLSYSKDASSDIWQTYLGCVLPSQPSKAWTITVYATTQAGSITRTVFTINKPLLPGDIRILQIAIDANGAATTADLGVGASVTLNWKKGGEYNPEI